MFEKGLAVCDMCHPCSVHVKYEIKSMDRHQRWPVVDHCICERASFATRQRPLDTCGEDATVKIFWIISTGFIALDWANGCIKTKRHAMAHRGKETCGHKRDNACIRHHAHTPEGKVDPGIWVMSQGE